jgi:hypothetical protein
MSGRLGRHVIGRYGVGTLWCVRAPDSFFIQFNAIKTATRPLKGGAWVALEDGWKVTSHAGGQIRVQLHNSEGVIVSLAGGTGKWGTAFRFVRTPSGTLRSLQGFCADITCGMGAQRAAVRRLYGHQFRAIGVGHPVVFEKSRGDLHHVQRSADREAVGGQENLGRTCSRMEGHRCRKSGVANPAQRKRGGVCIARCEARQMTSCEEVNGAIAILPIDPPIYPNSPVKRLR